MDAACGEGYGSEILRPISRKVVSLDLDAPTLVHARSRYTSPTFVRADLVKLPLDDASADGIVALQVIEHLAHPEGFVREARRVLRPEGVLVISTPNRATFPAGLNPFHVHEYDGSELRELLSVAFSEVRLLGLAHRAPLRWLEGALGEPLQGRLVRTPYAELPPALRAALRMVTARGFRLTRRPERALDLIAVCRSGPNGA